MKKQRSVHWGKIVSKESVASEQPSCSVVPSAQCALHVLYSPLDKRKPFVSHSD